MFNDLIGAISIKSDSLIEAYLQVKAELLQDNFHPPIALVNAHLFVAKLNMIKIHKILIISFQQFKFCVRNIYINQIYTNQSTDD